MVRFLCQPNWLREAQVISGCVWVCFQKTLAFEYKDGPCQGRGASSHPLRAQTEQRGGKGKFTLLELDLHRLPPLDAQAPGSEAFRLQ